MEPENKKKKYGFAAMSPEKRREISSKGGKASRDNGTLYKFSSEDCSEGGTKTSQNKDHITEIGQKGGEASRNNGTLYKFTSEDCRKAWKRN
jgi:hypothetical protein